MLPSFGLVAATLVGSAAFGAVLGTFFLGLHEGRRNLILASLIAWAVGGIAFYGLVAIFARSSQPMATTLAIASAAAGLIGGAGFGFGWGGKKGAVLLGAASLVGFPLAMVLGWWVLQQGAAVIDASGFDAGRRILSFALADAGFIIYGALLGLLTPLCEEGWTDAPASAQLRTQTGSNVIEAIEAGTREGRAAASSGTMRAVTSAATGASAIAAVSTRARANLPPPLEPKRFEPTTRSSSSLEFDEADIALTPYEEQNPESLSEDMPVLLPDFDLGARGGRPNARRNMHPDYAADAQSDDTPGIGGMNASTRRKLEVEVELEDGNDEAAPIEMERDDEYGFLDEE